MYAKFQNKKLISEICMMCNIRRICLLLVKINYLIYYYYIKNKRL